ncbi:MAG: NADPH:quinone oxidoreductase family protein [Deltaproteobacteria bacterium]|nr:MAG: NADPH:quinone oxidoreductase family protein [Deltaproteobacteria bacterium]
MKALVCRQFGPIENLAVEEIDPPRPGPGQVLVDVKASSLNFPDALMVQGLYQVKPPLPFSPGHEIAGVIEKLGEGVLGVAVGDAVIATPGVGGLAEQCVVARERITPLPAGMDFATASAFLLTYCTTLHALEDCGRLRSGESLLVLGAAGAVGTAAIEIGKALGARVIAAASSEEKLALCRDLGADETIDYVREDLRKRALELTGGKGVDVVYDPVGGALTEAALRASAWGGRLLVIGFASGEIPAIRLNLALLKERSIVGVYWGEWTRQDPAGQKRNVERLGELYAAGKVKPVVSERIRLAEVPAALVRMQKRQVKGKIVVVPEH